METTAVRVALRIRPLSEKEQGLTGTSDCINYVKDEPQIFLGNDRAFTFDHVFSPNDKQHHVFNTSVISLLDRFLDGNNATVVAYGQTGSGKTYSMGTSLESFPDSESQGIIQRFTNELFGRLEHKKNDTTFQIYVSYLELYNEDIVDLLCPGSSSSSSSSSTTTTTATTLTKKDETKQPAIREDIHGQIYWTGVREMPVNNKHELLEYVRKGSLSRSTGSTGMNTSSSRSHAILSVTLKQQISEQCTMDEQQQSLKRLVSKFHFVDLAGSERLKRTNALGDRQKEGISINTGLLALGNVISALGDESRKSSHVPYRDSKLTRLLQDSLGGNSHTLMLACVSPCASDYMETLNTLKYANRARNIQNRVEINVDYETGGPEEVTYLKNQLIEMKTQLSNLRQQQQQQQQHHHQLQHFGGMNGDYHSMEAELIRAKMYATSMAKDVAKLQAERDLLRHSTSHDPMETQPQTMEYLQHIQDLKFELAEANNRLVHIECQQQFQYQHLHQHPQHKPSVSVALPGRFGSNSPTHRRSKPTLSACGTPLDRSTRTGSVSTGGRRTIKQRKHSIPVGQRMKSTRKHTSFMTAPNSPPDLDELWRFLDSDSNDSMLTEIRDDNHSVKSHEMTSDAKQHADKKLNENNDKLISAYTPTVDSMIRPVSAKLDISTTLQPSSSPSMLPDSPVSTNTMCHDSILHDDNDDDIQMLAIPVWTDEPKAQSMTDSTKRESLSWTDSLLDDSDNSIATSRLSSTYWNTSHNGKKSVGRRRSKDMLKMLHQVQADLLVKKELVGQLEKSEGEYTQMRINYEDQLKSLQNHLVDMRYQRDSAIGGIDFDDMMDSSSTSQHHHHNNNNDDHPDTNIKEINKVSPLVIDTDSRHHHGTKPKVENARQRRLKAILSPQTPPSPQTSPPGNGPRKSPDTVPRQVKEIRLQYEGKIKRLSSENQEWKRKYTLATNSMTSARTKAEQVVTKLRSTIDQMKMEKKQLQRSAKQDNDRLRDQLALAEQEIQQLKRKEGIYLEARRKWDDTNEQQQALLKKRNDHALQVNQQMRQLNVVLRKAASEGTLLNEAALERLLAASASLPPPTLL